MDQEDVVYKNNGILLSNRKEWNPAICDNMDRTGPEGIMLREASQIRTILHDFTYVWS